MTTAKRVLGLDYITISGRGEREVYNGAHVKDSSYIHLGFGAFHPQSGQTACGVSWDKFMVSYSLVEINCPDCIKAVKGRKEEE